MAQIRDWERKALAATLTALAVTLYALRKGAAFPDYANAMEWILGLYITGQAAQQVGFAKFGLLAGDAKNPAAPQPKKVAVPPTVEKAP